MTVDTTPTSSISVDNVGARPEISHALSKLKDKEGDRCSTADVSSESGASVCVVHVSELHQQQGGGNAASRKQSIRAMSDSKVIPGSAGRQDQQPTGTVQSGGQTKDNAVDFMMHVGWLPSPSKGT